MRMTQAAACFLLLVRCLYFLVTMDVVEIFPLTSITNHYIYELLMHGCI